MERQTKEVGSYAADSTSLIIRASSLSSGVLYVSVAYLFCPYTVASCVAKTTTVFANLVLAATLAAMVKGK